MVNKWKFQSFALCILVKWKETVSCLPATDRYVCVTKFQVYFRKNIKAEWEIKFKIFHYYVTKINS